MVLFFLNFIEFLNILHTDTACVRACVRDTRHHNGQTARVYSFIEDAQAESREAVISYTTARTGGKEWKF